LFSKWPIRVKLAIGLGLLIVIVAILSSGGLYTTYTYRTVVKSLSGRVGELPLAAELSNQVSNLRVTLSELRGLRSAGFPESGHDLIPLRIRMVREQFRSQLSEADETLDDYCEQLERSLQADRLMADDQPERQTVEKIKAALLQVRQANQGQDWMFDDAKVGQLETDLDRLQVLAAELPSHLHAKLRGFAAEVRGQYRTLIVGIWITSVSAGLLFGLFVRLFFKWIFLPLRVLIDGSRRVASGDFGYRIRLETLDEMSELAEAMNDMTARFQAIRDDLDRQVQERTKQVVRNEQLASVGFLAAGVAHEINNPLASIAMCAESLEGRIHDVLESVPPAPLTSPGGQGGSDEYAVIRNYLGMIQSEAFRCKGITEKLLDFSRLGPPKRQDTELRELVQGVVDMIGHLGKYHGKRIELLSGQPVTVPINAQEIKQVVLNLLTNALDSLDNDGAVRIELAVRDRMAELTVADSGCGMEPAVLEHVFEPFFTRRRAGQGTGLGLSITYRIVADHGGTIDAQSPGPGLGATFRVRLPLIQTPRRREPQRHAA
jgi:two-component system, NtrC family, sensor kinase